MKDFILIMDFDSTFVSVEALDELSQICLKNEPKKIREIKKITALGMDGKIDFQESLKRRFNLLNPKTEHIKILTNILRKKITSSIAYHKKFFKENADRIFIISGGFREYIEPVVKNYEIKKENILTNEFTADQNGRINGYDKKNPLTRKGGKVETVRNLKLNPEKYIYVLGDGYTDYEIKKEGLAHVFFAFTENVRREEVAEKADREIKNFGEFIKLTR